MRGIIEHTGMIVKNKREAIVEAHRVLDTMLESDPHMKEPWVYVFRYDDPQFIWFSVGYVKREKIINYIQLPVSAQKTTAQWKRLDEFKARKQYKR